jgi:peptide/nickel transport system substrate-binding protein
MKKALGLRWAAVAVVVTALLVVVAACGAAETEVVEVVKEVPVEKEVIKEVIVEKEVVVEKVVVKEVPVEKVVVREKEVVVVATPLPPGEAPWMINLASTETKFGGHLRHATHGPMSHFDIFASGSISNMGPQGPMYDSMLRVNPHHPFTPVVGDLAHRWDISSDGMTYTFNIREGVKFHDGTDLTSEDLLASLNRIMFPETYQKGLGALRAQYFRGGVKEITAPDDFTIQITLAQSRSSQYIMGNLANGFNVITTKEVLDANEGDLKMVDTYPGTGPYKHLSRDSEKWVQEKFADYWNPNAGFLDRLTHVWLRAFSAPLSAALEGRALDFADYLAPGGYNAVRGRADGGGMKVFSGSINTMAFNNGKAPTDDVRVREAFALAMDAPAIKEMLMHIKLFQRTGWFDIGTPLARTPAELDKIPGFRSPTSEDIARAKQLLIDAGYPGCKGMPVLEMPIRDLPDRHLIVPAVQAMLKQNLGCESKTEIHQTSAIAEVFREGKFHIVPTTQGSHGVPGSAGGASLKKCDEPTNNLKYCNPEFDKVVDAFLMETDPQKANDLKLQIRGFWDADWPWVPHGETPIQYAWYSWVKGFPNFSVSTYEKNLHKLDWVWTTQSR